MLASLLVVFREVLEAGLIIGIVLAATRGVAGRTAWIAGGIAAGSTAAAILAVFAGRLSDAFSGTGQELFTASILGLAVVMLTWHVTWMSAHARDMAAEMKAAGEAVRRGQRSLLALAVVVGVAVLREGAEVGLFLFGISASGGQTALAMAAGSAAGLALAVAASAALYRGLTAIPLHRLFSTTNGLIILLAAGMAGQAAATLHSADLIPGWGERIWNTGYLIEDGTIAGRTLHALIGYSAHPCGVQLAAWATVCVGLLVLTRLAGARPAPRRAAGPAAAATGAAILLCLAAPPAHAAEAPDESPVLVFKAKRVVPDHLTLPAGQKIHLQLRNEDDAADEFESAELNREKLVSAGGTATVVLGPLEPGTYHFTRDFNQETGQGIIEVK